MIQRLSDITWPLLLGLIAGILKLLLTGSGKTRLQLLRSLLISILCGVLAGWCLEGVDYSEGLKALVISLSSIISGDLVEGVLKLSKSFKDNPKRMIDYILDLRLKIMK